MQTLVYVDHRISQDIKCLICLEPVEADALKISCHDHLSCSECIYHWLGSQLVRRVPTTCPLCRARVDASNLKAVHVSRRSTKAYEELSDQDSSRDSSSDDSEDEDEEDQGEESDQDLIESSEGESEGESEPRDTHALSDEDMELDDIAPGTVAPHNSSEDEMTSNVFEEQFAEHLSSVAAEDLNLGGIQHEGEMAIENEDMLKEPLRESVEEGVKGDDEEDLDSSDSSESDEESQEEIHIPNADDGTPEGFMRNNRYHNIVAQRPTATERSLLLSRQPDFENPHNFDYRPMPWNIMYASNLVPSTAFTIVAEYGADPQPIEYYFILVMKSTTVRELCWLWSLVNVGEEFQGMDKPSGFKYKGVEMGLGQTMEELGMDHGSTFTIPLAFGGVEM